VDVTYVGHPLAHASPTQIPRQDFAAAHDLDPEKQWIAMLPGSRQKEVLLNLPEMVDAAKLLAAQSNEFEFVMPLASTLDANWLAPRLGAAGKLIKLTDDAPATLRLSRAATVASGTATVEAALVGTPFVVVYRVAPLTWALGRRLVNLDTFAMPNLIAGRRIVTELIQNDFTAANILRELNAIIPEGARREQMLKDLQEVREKLRDSGNSEAPAVRAARAILNLIA
jgi:lipid-A-disaccharide synthase